MQHYDMPRKIEMHRTGSDLNNAIAICADEREPASGASYHYMVTVAHSAPDVPDQAKAVTQDIRFQKGAAKEVGVNGMSDEALIAIVIDRLQGFNEGAFRCRENSLAITKLEEALMWLQARTRDRVARGVEGRAQA